MMRTEQLPKQIVICAETDKKSGSDFIYINEFLKWYFPNIFNTIKIEYVPLKGKYNYNNKNIIKKINEHKKMESNTKVIFVFDKDLSVINPNDNKFINDVTNFCINRKFEIVWFVKNIENVMLGRSSNNKSKDAVKFREHENIKNVNIKLLNNPNPQTKTSSNILVVLESILGKTIRI